MPFARGRRGRLIIRSIAEAAPQAYLYAGMIKLFDPAWSSAEYVQKARVFGGLFAWRAGRIGGLDARLAKSPRLG